MSSISKTMHDSRHHNREVWPFGQLPPGYAIAAQRKYPDAHPRDGWLYVTEPGSITRFQQAEAQHAKADIAAPGHNDAASRFAHQLEMKL